MMNQEKRTVRVKKEEAVLNRVLLCFGAAVLAEGFLFLISRYCFNYRISEISMAAALYRYVMPGLMWVGLAALLAGAAWAAFLNRAGKRMSPALAVSLSGGALFVCFALCLTFGRISVQLMQVLVVVLAVFVFIYYLYQKEFFTAMLATGLGILGLWIYRRGFASHPGVIYAYAAAMALAALCIAAFARRVQRENGALAWRGKNVQLFPRGASYVMIYISCALAVGAVALSLALGASAAYYAIFALVAWLFVMAVYFTVRLL